LEKIKKEMKLSLVVFLATVFHEGIADFLVDQEAFFQSLKQFEKDRQEASSGPGNGPPVQEAEAVEDESAWNQFSLTKRSITTEKRNTIRLNFPDSLPKENGTGRVEVYHDNQWGTVCDRSWDGKDAFVVCNELGLVKAIHETKRAKYGQGIGPVWLNNVQCTGGERSLLDCPHSGWGNVGSCAHGNDAGVKCLQTGLPRLIEVGCYKDSESNRALRTLYAFLRLEIDWYNLRSMITKCAERAWSRGFRYFGIQFYGECWSDEEAETRYAMHGEVDASNTEQNCLEGTGMHWANFVYKFAPWADLGCWRDNKLDRAMSQLLVNLRFQIDWFNIGKTVDLCYQAAKKAGKKYFAVQFYGECWVDKDDSTYMKHGPSTACWSGVGKGSTNYVYKVEW